MHPIRRPLVPDVGDDRPDLGQVVLGFIGE